jgi:23S rRNA pseudouridine1911/1915/1917 synthase
MTLLECKLETGRTHQIRVHMASIGHPVYGDSKYGSKFDLGVAFFLHAAKLGFEHPITGERVEVSSELPPHLQAHLDGLKILA